MSISLYSAKRHFLFSGLCVQCAGMGLAGGEGVGNGTVLQLKTSLLITESYSLK